MGREPWPVRIAGRTTVPHKPRQRDHEPARDDRYWLGYTVTSIALYAVAFGAQALQMGMQFVQNVGTFLAQLPGNVAAWLASTAASIGAWVSSTAMQALQMGTQFLQNVARSSPSCPAMWLAGSREP